MVCPCFIEDYAGFCTSSDIPYVPSIDKMEKFCFTEQFASCMLYAGKGIKAACAAGRRGKYHGKRQTTVMSG
jgi:hypothetical protein